MATSIKISQLPAKGSNLEATDLLEISEFNGTGYVTKSITGAEIIASVPPTSVDWGDIGGTLSAQTDLNTALSGKVPTSRTLTINGTTQDLSADRTFTISTGITIGTTAITSGTVGRVLFEGTGNVVQESANLFWDNTNGRLGIGTSSPATKLHISSNIASNPTEATITSSTTGYNTINFLNFDNSFQGTILCSGSAFGFGTYLSNQLNLIGSTGGLALRTTNGANAHIRFYSGNANAGLSSEIARFVASTGNVLINTTTDAGFKLDVNGTARVQGSLTISASGSLLMNNNNIYIARGTGTATDGMEIRALSSGTDAVKVTTSCVSISSAGGLTYQASAQLAVDSTTRGFLPPRMTTTQKNAIASPATGLVVFDSTLNKLCVRGASAWETITSL